MFRSKLKLKTKIFITRLSHYCNTPMLRPLFQLKHTKACLCRAKNSTILHTYSSILYLYISSSPPFYTHLFISSSLYSPSRPSAVRFPRTPICHYRQFLLLSVCLVLSRGLTDRSITHTDSLPILLLYRLRHNQFINFLDET